MNTRLLTGLACAGTLISGCAYNVSSGRFEGGGSVHSALPLRADTAIGSFALRRVAAADCNGLAEVTATGSISGTTLTVTTAPAPVNGMSGNTFGVGSRITGKGVRRDTVILAQLSGASGMQGTYSINRAQKVPSTTITGHLNFASGSPISAARISVPDTITGKISWQDTANSVAFSCEFNIPNSLAQPNSPIAEQGALPIGNVTIGTFRGTVTTSSGSFSSTPATCAVQLLANANHNTSSDPQASAVTVYLYPSGATFDPSNVSDMSIYQQSGLVDQRKLQFRSLGLDDVSDLCGYDDE